MNLADAWAQPAAGVALRPLVAASDDGLPPFIARLVRLAEHRPVVAAQPVLDVDGAVLLARGERFDAAAAAWLAPQWLVRPVEECLAAEGGVEAARLAVEAAGVLDAHPLLARLAGRGHRAVAAVAAIPLPPLLALHLTVARELHPELHRHGLLSALACVALGGLALPAEDPMRFAALGLFHDIGLLHADGSRLGNALPAQVAAHPLVAARLLARHAAFAGDVTEAVAMHHERLDGSGFPRGLHADAIPPWGRVAQLAELVTTVQTGHGILDEMRLATMLRLDAGSLDAGLVAQVLAACDGAGV